MKRLGIILVLGMVAVIFSGSVASAWHSGGRSYKYRRYRKFPRHRKYPRHRVYRRRFAPHRHIHYYRFRRWYGPGLVITLGGATQYALEKQKSGKVTEWRDPDTGALGNVVVKRTFKNSEGRYCREFQQTIIIDGKQERAFGTACRQPDGQWEIVDTP